VNNAAVLILRNAGMRWMRLPDEPVIADGNIAEPGQPPQIDQQARGRQAEGENRHQALSPAMTNASGFDASRSFAKGAGGLVIEGRGFHCYTSRRKTEPSNCMPSVPGERRARDP
jgi:hypothetical protein